MSTIAIDTEELSPIPADAAPGDSMDAATSSAMTGSAMSAIATATGEAPAAVAQHVLDVALTRIDSSPTQPRKMFSEAHIRDLAKSIATTGLLHPVLVRPRAEGRYELIVGECRVRAHRLLGWPSIRAIVRDMTDVEVAIVQRVENLQRADLTPLDEAEGFAELLTMEEPVMTVTDLAERVGKDAAYIRRRVQLTHLVKEAKTALVAGDLSLRVALQLARLVEGDQRDLLPWATRRDPWGHRPSEAQVKAEIERRYFLDLGRAPFDTADATLFPERGACLTCPRRTGAAPDLFPEVTATDTCTDRRCFAVKRDTHVERVMTVQLERAKRRGGDVLRLSSGWRAEDSQAGVLPRGQYVEIHAKDKCEFTRVGVFVDGPKAGKVVRVCTDATCRTHRGAGVRATTDYRAHEREQRKAIERERLIRRRILDAAVAALAFSRGPVLALDDLRLVATAMMERLWAEHTKRVARACGVTPAKNTAADADDAERLRRYIATLDAPGLFRLMVRMALMPDVWPSIHDGRKPTRLLALAARAGVDPARIRADLGGAAIGAKRGRPPKAATPPRSSAASADTANGPREMQHSVARARRGRRRARGAERQASRSLASPTQRKH